MWPKAKAGSSTGPPLPPPEVDERKDQGSEDNEQLKNQRVPRQGFKLSSIRKFLRPLLQGKKTTLCPSKDSSEKGGNRNEPCEKDKDVNITGRLPPGMTLGHKVWKCLGEVD